MSVPLLPLGIITSSFPSGRSCLSVDEETIAVTNLFDGVDRYDISHQELIESLKTTIVENVMTLIILDDDGFLAFGGSSGAVQILKPTPMGINQTLELDRK